MTILVDTITAPDFWASALVNGDMSGMTEEEIAAMNEYLAPLYSEGWGVVDVVRDDEGNGQEPRFIWSYSLHGGTAKGGSVIDYVIHKIT